MSGIARIFQRSGIVKPQTAGGPTLVPRISRKQLPHIVREMGFVRGAEIGVWKGAFSALFCIANPDLHMLCVDPWLSYPAWRDTKNEMPPEDAERIMNESYTTAKSALARHNCTIVRNFSTEAAKSVPDASLDFVYIDSNHVYDAVIEDIKAWTPKVRPGGIVSGHDYRVFSNKPTIHVVRAVNDYTKAHGIDPWYVLSADKTPSFLWEVN